MSEPATPATAASAARPSASDRQSLFRLFFLGAFAYLIYVLIVVSVGGLASIGGSFVAAALLGISDMAGKYYVPQLGSCLIYLVMVGILMWRPAGLFGKR